MFAAIRRLLPFAAALLAAVSVAAAPPPVKTQAPGFFRTMVGAFEVTALYDGNLRLAPTLLHGIAPGAIAELTAHEFVDTNGQGIATSLNAFLVNTGEHLILVDTGLGVCGPGFAGHLQENLKAAGYRAEDIDAVLITHMHGDHVCGLMKDGQRLFPKATVYASEPEIAYWLAKDTANAAAPHKQGVPEILKPYQDAGALKGFKPGAQLFAGVTALDTHGHTPGHTSYLFQSGGKSFLAMGDILHVHAIQFSHPDVTIDYDSDQATARAARLALFDRVAKESWLVGGAHLPFPGLGHIRKYGAAYAYVRAEYAPLQ
jgi:glyoxylase-like metal-dependent hydrolase (beta-lactamase superfamily II)